MKTTKSVKERSGRCSVLAFGPGGRKPLSLEKEEPEKDAENGLGAGKESLEKKFLKVKIFIRVIFTFLQQ